MNSERQINTSPVPTREDILTLLAAYGYQGNGEIRLIDTSFGPEDIRLHCIIDKKWVLRFSSAEVMSERRLSELNRLIERYRSFGLRCPAFLPAPDGRFCRTWNGLCVYLAEYIDLPTAREAELRDPGALWREVQDSVAAFAETYRGVDLSETLGMYSLFELSPYDRELGKDEKQQNFERLLETLLEIGQDTLTARLEEKHGEVRGRLRAVYRSLPRCVFQGDENFGNVLVDERQHLAGFIDFNMAGTEVIVNQFANLGDGFEHGGETPIGAKKRLALALEAYRSDQARMLRIYHATEGERAALRDYTWLAFVAGWPQLCYFRANLKNEALREEMLGLLALLAEGPETWAGISGETTQPTGGST